MMEVTPHLKSVLKNYQYSATKSLQGPGLSLNPPTIKNELPSPEGAKEEEEFPNTAPFTVQQVPILAAPDTSCSERSETKLEGEAISCFVVGGEKRLCLPQVLNSVLRDFSLQEINRECDHLQIYCSRCTPEQLNVLKSHGILPSGAPSCGLITKTDAERLCSALLFAGLKNLPLRPRKGITSFPIYHECFGEARGRCYPDLYTSKHAKCIECSDCQGGFSPQQFVCHVHRNLENRTVHWGFDSSSHWRAYLHVPDEQTDQKALEKILDDLKDRYEGKVPFPPPLVIESTVKRKQMPRNYVRKTSGPSYTKEDVIRAVEDVKNKNKTYKQAQNFYGVPASVICQRLTGKRKTAIDCSTRGRKTALTKEVEDLLETCLINRAEYGYPCDKEEFQNVVKAYVETTGIKTTFKGNKPGDDWYYDFLKRHPRLSVKKPEHLQKLRKDARKPDIIYCFYNILNDVVNTNNLNDIEKACFIFNADESGFPSDPSRIRAIGKKGTPLCRVSGGSGRENTTVLACVGADGSVLPPLIIFKGAAVQARWISDKAFPGTQFATSSNGWMEEPQFFHWLTGVFIPHVEKIRCEKLLPGQAALLMFDGHASHMSVRILEEAIKHNILLIKLPSHLTDKLQPLDKCVFGPVKTFWEKLLISYGKKKLGTGTGRLGKSEFSELLGVVWTQAMKPDNIISGFRTTGTFPVESSRFPISEFSAEDLRIYQENLHKKPEDNDHIQESATQSQPVIAKVSNVTSNTEALDAPSTSSYLNEDSDTVPITSHIEIQETPRRQEPCQPNCENSNPFVQVTSDIIGAHTTSSDPSVAVNNQSLKKETVSQLNEVKMLFFKKPDGDVPNIECVKPTYNIRLKQRAYGEVLTTVEVLQRLKEAEEKKQLKGKKTGTKNKRNIEHPEASTSGKQQKIKKKKKPRQIENSSSSDEAEIALDDVSDGSFENENHEIEVLDINPCTLSDLATGNFIFVNFKGGKRGARKFKYVCAIENMEENIEEIKVVGLKSVDSSYQNFAVVETDISYITFNQIIGLLPMPLIQNKGERIFYHFDKKIPVIEQ